MCMNLSCTMNGSITSLKPADSSSDSVVANPISNNRTSPDFVSAERLLDQSGQYQVHISFGEITERATTSNYIVEGVFYE